MEDSQKELALATKAREAEDAELNQSADAHIVNSSEWKFNWELFKRNIKN